MTGKDGKLGFSETNGKRMWIINMYMNKENDLNQKLIWSRDRLKRLPGKKWL